MAQALAYGLSAQGGGEEPGGEGVARADGGDDVDVQGGHGGGVGAVEGGGAARTLFDDEQLRLGQRGADGLGSAETPGVPCLVVADEDEVGAAGQFQEHFGTVAVTDVAPQAGAVVDVEGDEGRPGRRAVSSRIRPRQSAESAGVMPDRCRTRPERIASRSMVSTDIAEAAEPAR